MNIKNDYENRFLYRLVKVTYYLALVSAIGIFSLFGWYSRPTTTVDREKSTIVCKHLGVTPEDTTDHYLLEQTNIYPSTEEKEQLSDTNDQKVTNFCKEMTINRVLSKYSPQEQTIHRPTVTESVSVGYRGYSFNFVGKTEGSWNDVILWLVFGVGGSYVVLNLIRETLNYLFLGKQFDLKWTKSSNYHHNEEVENTQELNVKKDQDTHVDNEDKKVRVEAVFMPTYKPNTDGKDTEKVDEENKSKSRDKKIRAKTVFMPTYKPKEVKDEQNKRDSNEVKGQRD